MAITEVLGGKVGPAEITSPPSTRAYFGPETVARWQKRYPDVSEKQIDEVFDGFVDLAAAATVTKYLPILFERRLKESLAPVSRSTVVSPTVATQEPSRNRLQRLFTRGLSK